MRSPPTPDLVVERVFGYFGIGPDHVAYGSTRFFDVDPDGIVDAYVDGFDRHVVHNVERICHEHLFDHDGPYDVGHP